MKKSELVEGKIYYVPQVIQSWREVQIDNLGAIIPVNPASYMGKFFLPVFESEEALRKEYPDAEIVMLKTK